MARMDLITEPRQVLVRTLDVATCGTVNDTNSFWGLAPSTGVRSRYTFLTVESLATTGTRWKPNLRGTYVTHFFCFTNNLSADDPATIRAGFVLDPSTAAQQADPSNATIGIYGLDADVLPSLTVLPTGNGGAISMCAPTQIDDTRIGSPTLGWIHVLLGNGANGTPVGVVSAGATLTITRTADLMGSWT